MKNGKCWFCLWLRKWQLWAAVAATVAGVTVAAESLNLPLPRPAWISEVSLLEARLADLEIAVLESRVAGLELWAFELEDRIATGSENGSAPVRLRDIRTQIEKTNGRLRKIRGF